MMPAAQATLARSCAADNPAVSVVVSGKQQ
jgi:hypothetical protein